MKWQTFVVILYTFPAISMCDESWLNHLYNYLFWISPSFSASDRNSLAINSGNYSGHWNQEQNRWKIMENPAPTVTSPRYVPTLPGPNERLPRRAHASPKERSASFIFIYCFLDFFERYSDMIFEDWLDTIYFSVCTTMTFFKYFEWDQLCEPPWLKWFHQKGRGNPGPSWSQFEGPQETPMSGEVLVGKEYVPAFRFRSGGLLAWKAHFLEWILGVKSCSFKETCLYFIEQVWMGQYTPSRGW